MSVISLRLKERELRKLQELSIEEQKDKSTVARELIREGWDFLMIRQYRQGKLSSVFLRKGSNSPFLRR